MGISLRTVATVVDRLGDNKRERRVLLRDLETTAPAKIATGKKLGKTGFRPMRSGPC